MYTSASTPVNPSSSDSVNFWFCARSSSRSALVETETSFPVGYAPNSRASPADTSGIESSIGIDGDVGAGWDSVYRSSPLESKFLPSKLPANVFKEREWLDLLIALMTYLPNITALRDRRLRCRLQLIRIQRVMPSVVETILERRHLNGAYWIRWCRSLVR